jgi:monooxygenase
MASTSVPEGPTRPEPAPGEPPPGEPEHFDVVVVGAGLSGIGAGYHLQTALPHKRYVILEARGAIGGTWDLFRYPGVRSDSDMYTLGYPFRPWDSDQAIASGATILDYVRATAREHRIDERIRFGHRVSRVEWSSREHRWRVRAERLDTGQTVHLTCGFLFMCTGYYRYDQGYTPELPNLERFQGAVVHPQFWPDGLGYAGSRVVVIGSGATAVTLVPVLAREARHVTMLQRSPSYVVSLPAQDPLARLARRLLPARLAYRLVRWKNTLLMTLAFQLSRRRPETMKKLIRRGVERSLPPGYDVETHFTPRYNPWDQRLCLVPDADLFEAIREGRASVVTERIATFTDRGLRLASGEELEADLVVTATGLNLLMLGGIEILLDGQPVDIPERLIYRGCMLSGIPNLAFSFGYTNASWTLRCDLTCRYVVRLLAHMDAHGYAAARPREREATMETLPFADFSSGYIVRSLERLPKQGTKPPWRLHQNYLLDLANLHLRPLDEPDIDFSPDGAAARPLATASAAPP